MSYFSLLFLPLERITPDMPKFASFLEYEKHSPIYCLALEDKGANELAMFNSWLRLSEGNAYMQISLSEFYKGMSLLLENEAANYVEKGVYLPTRTFNPDCLLTSNGHSIISRLAEICDYIVIEDADLTPVYLLDHTKTHSLSSIAICDMTKTLNLKSNYAYVIWNKDKTLTPSINGELLQEKRYGNGDQSST